MATALVTGANRGIGLSLCRLLSERGDDVIAVCRKASPELEKLDVRTETGIDVTSDDAVAKLQKRLGDTKLDWVFLNAGVLRSDSLEHLDFDGMRQQFEVNALGVLRTASALLPCLHEGSKIEITTSRMGSIEDNTSGRAYGYRMSKAAVNMAGVSLANDLRSRGIAVAIVHPGFVKTDMTGRQGNVDPDESARGIIQRVDELSLETSGSFWHANGERLPW